MNEELVLEKAREVRTARHKWEKAVASGSLDEVSTLFKELENKEHELLEAIAE